MVRERYKTHHLDSDAAVVDRRISFAAYAYDPFPMVSQIGEPKEDFKIDHFYDEPTPELKEQLTSDA